MRGSIILFLSKVYILKISKREAIKSEKIVINKNKVINKISTNLLERLL